MARPRGSNNRRAHGSPRKDYSRTDRISEAIREIVATELERIGDERLDLVTVTGVTVDNDLNVAKVYYSALIAEGEGRLDQVSDGFDAVRWPIQTVVNRQIRARKTPQITFLPDDVLTSALRIEDILAASRPVDDPSPSAARLQADGGADPDDDGVAEPEE